MSTGSRQVSSEPRVSVIVPTRELTDDGRACLSALVALGEHVEVLLVADGPAPGAPTGVRCLPSGPVPVSDKRQLGLEQARGKIIALIDDDAYPHRSWLDYVEAAFAEDGGVGAVCGPTITPGDSPKREQLSGRVYALWLVSGPNRWRYAFTDARDVDDAPSVNLAFRREDALEIRFDSPYYPGDDTIVCNRLIRRGRRIRYAPGAIVFHRRRPLWRGHLQQVWRFGRHRGAFARTIGGNSARPAYFAPSLLALGLGLGWALPGSGRRWWRAGALVYALACAASAMDRDPGTWLRVGLAIPATHACYGTGFLLGFFGLPLDELRRKQ